MQDTPSTVAIHNTTPNVQMVPGLPAFKPYEVREVDADTAEQLLRNEAFSPYNDVPPAVSTPVLSEEDAEAVETAKPTRKSRNQ